MEAYRRTTARLRQPVQLHVLATDDRFHPLKRLDFVSPVYRMLLQLAIAYFANP
ncbi:hypothetical protein BLA6860_03240 [Burkholderia lata]|nr:hypothetical protein BLA6860_03240 [Burkholderia lata]